MRTSEARTGISDPTSGSKMDLLTVLAARDEITDEAAAVLERANLKHYAAADPAERHDRLRRLLDLVAICVTSRDLIPMVDHATEVANERFHAGFDIGEVQAAFNVLEEILWKRIVTSVPSDDLAEATGLLTTVLGAGKDALSADLCLAREQTARPDARPASAVPALILTYSSAELDRLIVVERRRSPQRYGR